MRLHLRIVGRREFHPQHFSILPMLSEAHSAPVVQTAIANRRAPGSLQVTILSTAQMNVLRYWLKAHVRFDIALQKDCYVLLATTIFNVVAVP